MKTFRKYLKSLSIILGESLKGTSILDISGYVYSIFIYPFPEPLDPAGIKTSTEPSSDFPDNIRFINEPLNDNVVKVDEEMDDPLPVPQVKVGSDGQIILDENDKTTPSKKAKCLERATHCIRHFRKSFAKRKRKMKMKKQLVCKL